MAVGDDCTMRARLQGFFHIENVAGVLSRVMQGAHQQSWLLAASHVRLCPDSAMTVCAACRRQRLVAFLAAWPCFTAESVAAAAPVAMDGCPEVCSCCIRA